MKKLLSIVLCLVLLMSLTACGGAKPEAVVTDFCEMMKTLNFEKSAACFESGLGYESPYTETDSEEFAEIFGGEQSLEFMTSNAKKMTYTVGEAVIDGDTAVVPVTFSFVDAGDVMRETFSEYLVQAFALAFSGADDAAIEEIFGTIFAEKIESVETGITTATVEFNCVKVGSDWKICDFDEDTKLAVNNVLTLNLVSTMETITEGFEEAFSEDITAE